MLRVARAEVRVGGLLDDGIQSMQALPPDQAGRCFTFAFSGASLEPCSAGVEIWPIDVQKWAQGE